LILGLGSGRNAWTEVVDLLVDSAAEMDMGGSRVWHRGRAAVLHAARRLTIFVASRESILSARRSGGSALLRLVLLLTVLALAATLLSACQVAKSWD
jgi:hypothetical protein